MLGMQTLKTYISTLVLSIFASVTTVPANAQAITQALEMIAPTKLAVQETTASATTTFGTLFMSPGVVQYNAKRYDVPSQGLLSLFAYSPSAYGYAPYRDGGFRIVADSGNLDHYAVIGAIGALIDYGSAHEGLTTAQKMAAMRSGPIAMRCGHSSDLAIHLLGTLGVTARRVHLLTADAPDGLDEGHVAIEVLIDGEWRFFDVPGDSYFRNGTAHLNVADLIDLGVTNADHVKLAETYVNTTGLLRALWAQRYSTTPDYLEWAARIFQIPGIYDPTDGLIYYYMPAGTETRQSWVLNLSTQYRVISKAAWLAKFYP